MRSKRTLIISTRVSESSGEVRTSVDACRHVAGQTKLAGRKNNKRLVAEKLERDIKSGKKVRAQKVIKAPRKPRKDKVAGRLAGALTDLPVEITNLVGRSLSLSTS